MHANIINAVLFQLCWFLAVLGGWIWVLPAVVIMGIHYFASSRDTVLDIKLPLVIGGAGMAMDGLFGAHGVYAFGPEPMLSTPVAVPLWLCLLWIAFGLTLTRSLAWLVQRSGIFIPLCAVAGPLAYLAGRETGAIGFGDNAVVGLVLEWLLIAMLALWTYRASQRDPAGAGEEHA
jgi:hypothetical protein